MFSCDRCGICCQHINRIADLAEFDNGEGICIHLTVDKRCDIYKNRPLICNVDKYYSLVMSDKMTKQEWYAINTDSCLKLKALEHTS